jgi:hypothetical protein
MQFGTDMMADSHLVFNVPEPGDTGVPYRATVSEQ